MKKRLKKTVNIIISVLMMLNSFLISAFASPAHEIKTIITESNGSFVISLYVPSPEKLTGIDLTVTINSDTAIINDFDTKNTDSEKYSFSVDSLPDISDINNTYFTFSHTLNEKKAAFSGYFVNSFSSEQDFYICNITVVSADEFTEKDTVTVKYDLTCKLCSKTDTDTYYLINGEHTDSDFRSSFPLGDADMNGKVSASDARTILRVSVGLDTLSLQAVPFVNCDYDNKISASDARYALRASVGLEKTVTHSFDITIDSDSTCEKGGLYTFMCEITGKSFSMEIENGGHICPETDCFSTGKCIVCNEIIRPATGHKFDKNGICSVCQASESQLNETADKLIPVLEKIVSYDTLADEALQKNDYLAYIENIYKATEIIKKAAEICDGINGMEDIEEHIEKAYKIRFDAFVECMDDNGLITANSKNCTKLSQAVKLSNVHIDYASYLND